jgi:diacylglycerol kinase (ATP)
MTNPHKGRTGLDRIIHATGYSIEGLRSAYRFESAFRQETWAAAVMAPTAFWLGRSGTEVLLLLAAVVLVMMVELLNSGIEAAIDRISLDHHELSKRAKDQASAAVFLSVLLCGGVWGTVLWQRFSPWLLSRL